MRIDEITKDNKLIISLMEIVVDYSEIYSNIFKTYSYYMSKKDLISLIFMLDNEINPRILVIENFINDEIENLDQNDPDIPAVKNQAQDILNKLQSISKEINNMLHK
jgi:hypothetical protein